MDEWVGAYVYVHVVWCVQPCMNEYVLHCLLRRTYIMGQYITFLYIITYCVQTYMSCHAAYAYVEIGGEYVHMSFVLTCVIVYGVGEGWESTFIHACCTWFVAVADSDLSLANPICPIQMYMTNSIRSCVPWKKQLSVIAFTRRISVHTHSLCFYKWPIPHWCLEQ